MEHVGLLLSRLNEYFEGLSPSGNINVGDEVAEVLVIVKVEEGIVIGVVFASIDAITGRSGVGADVEGQIVGRREFDHGTL